MFTGVQLHSAHITMALTTGSHCVGCFNSLSLSDTGLFGPVVLSVEVSKSAVNFRKSLSLHRIIIHPETVLSSHQMALPSCSLPLKAEEMSTSYLWTRQSVYLSREAEKKAKHLAQNLPQGPPDPSCLIRRKVSIQPHLIQPLNCCPPCADTARGKFHHHSTCSAFKNSAWC